MCLQLKKGDVPYKFHCHVSLLEVPSLKLTARTWKNWCLEDVFPIEIVPIQVLC